MYLMFTRPGTYCLPCVQWSKGEYTGANNQQDDFAVMNSNGMPLRTDDVGNTSATASTLNDGTISAGVTTYTTRGIIHASTDVDVFSFTSQASSVTATVAEASRSANLDAVLTLTDSTGAVLSTANPIGVLGATLTLTVPSAGTYFVSVQGTGEGDPLVTGYSSYGSLGNYALTVSATVQPTGTPPTAVAAATSAASGAAPLTVSFSAAGSSDSDGTIASYVWTFGDGTPTATGVTTSHVFSTVGTFSVTVRVTDNSGLSATGSSPPIVVTASASQRIIHVAKLTLALTRKRRTFTAVASVRIVDAAGSPVQGATVSGVWSGMSAASSMASGTATTGPNGVAFAAATSLRKQGTAVFTVTGVSLPGTSYDPAANARTLVSRSW